MTDTDETNENSKERTTLNPWCFDHVNIPLNTDALLHEIRAGAVWIISDGSYDLTRHYGTAAWALECKLSKQRIFGTVITPEDVSDLSAYRCELVGILAAITVINAIAFSHDLSAALTLHCDCETGIDKAFFNYKKKTNYKTPVKTPLRPFITKDHSSIFSGREHILKDIRTLQCPLNNWTDQAN